MIQYYQILFKINIEIVFVFFFYIKQLKIILLALIMYNSVNY